MDYQTAHSHHTWASLFLVLHTQPPTLVVYFNQLSGTCCTFFQVKSVENWQKTFKKVKKSTEKDKFGVPPQGVDQLLHVVQLWDKNWKKNCSFQTFFSEITEKGLKWTKKVENGWKKCFDQLSVAASTWKLVEIHNKLLYGFYMVKISGIFSNKWQIKN